MKNLILLSFCFALLFTCQDDEAPIQVIENIDLSECFSNVDEWKDTTTVDYFYDIREGRINFDLEENAAHPKYDLEAGDDLVFIFRKITYDNVWGAGLRSQEERIVFQIENNIDSFLIETVKEFSESNFTYASCNGKGWGSISTQKVIGSISGSKISDTQWKINAELNGDEFHYKSREIEFSEIFATNN